MTVFALLISYDYAGDQLLGIYSTADLAELAYAELCRSSGVRYGDEYRVVEIAMDAVGSVNI
jgi:hypothetical protein